ncbi:MAG: methyltransferase domain-containing protein [Candidatus Brockarchaeota archaeon]|nr:methyltransferase domain-containing protein [Candidatus Brockarchaeota archaeon]
MEVKLLLTFPVGIEDVVREEIREKIDSCIIEESPLDTPGKLIIQLPESKRDVVSSLRSVDSIMDYLGSFKVDKDKSALDKICQEILNIDFPEDFRNASSFRVTCDRRGKHDYTSMDVEKAVGQVLVDKYRLKVKLEGFEANVFIEIVEDACFVGLLREEYLRGRYFVFHHPAAIKPSIAYAMIKLADVKPGMTILDPMCGGGTILIEAALTLSDVKLYGFDISEYFLEGGVLNSEAMSLSDRIIFKKVDCRNLSKIVDFKVDRIITNPPYGTKPIFKINPRPLYLKCLIEMSKVLAKDGKIVIITIKPDCVKNALDKAGLKIEHERTVKHNDTNPEIIILTKNG